MAAWQRRCFALLRATVLLTVACHGSDVAGGTTTVSGLVIAPDSVTVSAGSSAQLTATDATGRGVQGVAWTSSDPSKATVSSSGLVLPVSPGRVIITAGAGGKTATAIVRSSVSGNFTIVDAQFTQGMQAADGSIPMVLGGNAAVVNVLLKADNSQYGSTQVVLRLFDAGGALVHTDTVRATATAGAAPGYGAPNAQFLVSAATLPSVASWQVVRDPLISLPDTNPTDDIFPRTGHNALAKVTVPPLTIRFVPIILTAPSSTAQVTVAQLPAYLRTVKSLHPVGTITATVGAAFTTTASFGTAPTGGDAPFWQQMLAELDLARVADVVDDPTTYWMGIMVPPTGFTYTIYGGFGYIPASGTSHATGTRTAIGLQMGWSSRASASRDGVAHELGHNFGRQHAPCGGAGSPDPNFPNTTGTIGSVGHDVFSWANGDATSAVPQPATTGDLMGYCTPVWISEYMYRNVMQFRGTTAASLQSVTAPVRSLIVRGHIEDGSRVVLEPAFTITARPTAPERSGPYQLVGRTASGGTLFSYSFAPAVLDHSSSVQHFLFAIPVTPAIDDSLATIEVTGAGAGALLQSSAAGSLRASVDMGPAAAAGGGGAATFACADPGARGILVLDRLTGGMLATASASSVAAATTSGQRVSVVCSDGVRSVRSDVVSP
jgi:hypothetical protein